MLVRALRLAVVGLAVSLTAATQSFAAGAAKTAHAVTLRDDIARLIRYRVDKQRRATGVVVGIVETGQTPIVIAYGPTDTPRARRLDGDSVFEIASLTKVFTALLLTNAVMRHEVTLDQPIVALLPKAVRLPSFAGRPITLTDLATHGSGLPLRPGNLHVKADTPNKYAEYTIQQLYGGLADMKLTRAPGTQFEYSNLGFAILGQALANRAHVSYDTLLRARITGPLGLSDTRMGIDAAAKGRLAQGHDVDLRPIGSTDDGALNPAGGLKSTVNDLLRFLSVFIGRADSALTPAARMMLTVDRPGDDAQTRMALGWRRVMGKSGVYYWSNGSGDGSRAFMGFNPSLHVAIVALANASSADGVDDIARHVLDPAAVVDVKIQPFHRLATLSDAALNRFIGTYRTATGDTIGIARGATGLIITIGKGQFLMYPESNSRLFAKVADLQFDFRLPSSGPAESFTGQQDGQAVPDVYRRIKNQDR